MEHVCDVEDLDPGEALGVEVDTPDGKLALALVRDAEGAFHALRDECTHGNVALSDGEVDGCTVECWLHGSRFDLVTGRPTGLPATKPVQVYPVTLAEGRVLVDVGT